MKAAMWRWTKRVALALLGLVLFRVLWHHACADDARALLDARAEPELLSRRAYLASELDHAGAGAADSQFAGEWAIVTLSMTAVAAANIGFDHPDAVDDGRTLAERACRAALDPGSRGFDTARWGADALTDTDASRSHLGYFGHVGMALEAYRLLGGKDPELLAKEALVVSALGKRMAAAKVPLLPTYPGERYVADNAVAHAVLALSDVGRKDAHATLLRLAMAHVASHLVDGATGVVVFGFDESFAAAGEARASGAAWSLFYWAQVDRDFVRAQASALRDHFRKRLLPGASGVCERASCTGAGDVDSGPLVLGVSPAATGFAIGAARIAGDEEWLSELLSTAEWAGVTLPFARRRYALAPLVGEAIVLAMKTARAWDDRYLTR